ncbi:putative required for hyphal anastomosis [Erysiphe necator]|uniref:Putative required for hyphal anastomosis n=1 Tax=Uncinula necator TaxID=52586 RepID=A0A0B1NZR3_UNCNE|nr:putative required for hyphal anastomosis [Erysiphe necator]
MEVAIDSTDNGSTMYTPFFPKKNANEFNKDDVADTGLPVVDLSASVAATSVPMTRPQVRRQQSQASLAHQLPIPPTFPQQISYSDSSNDALSLNQFRRIVNELSKPDLKNFVFTYEDTAAFEDEINEWFSYTDTEYRRLLLIKEKFERQWKKFGKKSWLESDLSEQRRFLEKEIEGLLALKLSRRCKSLQTILHVILGVWHVTAQADYKKESSEAKNKVSKQHLEHIKRGIDLLAECGGIPILFDILKNSLNKISKEGYPECPFQENELPYFQIEIESVATIFYLVIEGVRNYASEMKFAHKSLTLIASDLLDYLIKLTASLRWDESHHFPQTKILLLLWKSILLTLGGVSEAITLKKAVCEKSQEDSESIISASPLDYHIFRQEIISKYPAYIPPQPLVPLEPDDHSFLPPISSRKRRANGSDGFYPSGLNASSSGASILHQSVHIATPAPSPPPSPPVGGKAGKKQNYQTNQNFPFLYPPLDYTSSCAGGKGLAGLQGRLVGWNWNGSDIPKSIIEAGEIYAQRMRMTRSLRQLWEEREKYMKSERGWDTSDNEIEDEIEVSNLDFISLNDIEGLDIDSIILDSISTQNKNTTQKNLEINSLDCGPKTEVSDEILRKLELIEKTYKNSLPQLQSLVIVLLKALWICVPNILTQSHAPHHSIAAGPKEVNLRINGHHTHNISQDSNSIPLLGIESSDFVLEELETFRLREITIKAVSAILLLFLKWFKVSHILKFEYITQLLLDSNYLPLVLKVFAHQDTDKHTKNKTDKDDMSFFAFCNANSLNSGEEELSVLPDTENSEDEAVPPPIKNNSNQNIVMDTHGLLPSLKFEDGKDTNKRQNPESPDVSHLKTESCQDNFCEFSWRSLFSTINLLRVMQKICKNKTHRNLLLVQYKSSQILKRILRLPQSDVRMYTLKLLKNQVPFYGRKWRQGNMRVITAIYLHCRPELRDDWLAGCDINADVEDALPLEQALRALTHWYNVKHYPNQMGVDTKLFSTYFDFFIHELEKMKIIDETLGDGDGGPKANLEYANSNGC